MYFPRKRYLDQLIAHKHNKKAEQEAQPLQHIQDSFKKIIVVKEDILLRRDDSGIVTMGLRKFITNENSIFL